MSNTYVHSKFLLLLIKQIFEKTNHWGQHLKAGSRFCLELPLLFHNACSSTGVFYDLCEKMLFLYCILKKKSSLKNIFFTQIQFSATIPLHENGCIYFPFPWNVSLIIIIQSFTWAWLKLLLWKIVWFNQNRVKELELP